MYRSYCINYVNGRGETALGSSLEDVRRRHQHLNNGIKGVFTMGISHIDDKDTTDTIDDTTNTIDD
jgi:hypothetical protein